MAETRTFTARWVFPVAGPPLERGTLTVAGNAIADVDAHGVCSADADLGNVAIIPGLVNAHTHLDLSGARGLIPPTDPEHFTDWLRGVIAYRRTRTDATVDDDIQGGLAEILHTGTTLVGDIAYAGRSFSHFLNASLRSVVFCELTGFSSQRINELSRSLVGSDWGMRTEYTSSGLSPHAPYSVSAELLEYAISRAEPLAIHLAESLHEAELLSSRTGPFVELLQWIGIWDQARLVESADWIMNKTTQTNNVVFAHCNYLSPDTPFTSNQSIVYCPRTHAAFGHPPHPFREFLNRGVRVCLGTDSLASNPDLDVLAEARFVHERYPDFPGGTLLRMVTLSGAQALGWADEVGSLEPGKSADFVAVPLPDRDAADPHELLFAADAPDAPRRTLFRGEWRGSSG